MCSISDTIKTNIIELCLQLIRFIFTLNQLTVLKFNTTIQGIHQNILPVLSFGIDL